MDQINQHDSEQSRPVGTEYGINEALLRSEIGFWRELIDSSDSSQPAEYIERMQQALALAESRLACLFETYRQTGRAGLIHRPTFTTWKSDAGKEPSAGKEIESWN
jgi:hypothetical protein